jgi:HD-GYP domain-containing protein (c-di-GMP phosphodiesterase class II)
LVADALGLRPEERWRTVAAARFLDLGHVTIPDSIVTKPGRLTARQRALIHRHPAEGARLLRLAPGMADVAAIVADHHERLDGTGYPQGKVGGEIGIEARIVAACDAWAAMLADRAHRKALTPAQARTELERAAGGGLDSDVVDALIALHCDGLIGAATVAAAV